MKITILMKIILPTILITSGNIAQTASDNNKIASRQSTVQKVADGFRFTEGPTADNEGNIYFTDIDNNRIHKFSIDGKVSTFMENTEQANGLFFERGGNIIACVGGAGKVVSIDPKGNKTVIADKYEGKPFNSPNDLCADPNGGIYFTDPRYGQRNNMPQDGEYVYYISPDRKQVKRVITDLVRPNGVVGTPDGKILYVADHGGNKTYVYKINQDGTLTDKKIFANQGSDGMDLDRYGNVYLTGRGVSVYNPSGILIQTIRVPEMPTNVCFGGKDKKTLFITAQKSLYSIRMLDNFYLFNMNDIDGKAVSLSQYRGSVLLVVNVASKCGFTGQYAGLEQLYRKYKDQGFYVLGFPANNFGGQEPGTNSEIKEFCSSNFNVTFPMFSKISVAGEDIHPLYEYLTNKTENAPFGGPIEWNFNKFLIGKDGRTIGRYPSKVEPLDPQIVNAVESALKEGNTGN